MEVELPPIEPQEVQLTADEKALRDAFIGEYMKDFHPFYAAIRCGFPAAHAAKYGKELFEDAYVQKAIIVLTRKPIENDDEQARIDREHIMNTYRNAMSTGSKSEAIAAARALAAMRGFEKPDTIGDAASTLAEVMKNFAQLAPV